MTRQELLIHFAKWLVDEENDHFLPDAELRKEIVDEYIEMYPENINVVPRSHNPTITKVRVPDRKRKAWTKGPLPNTKRTIDEVDAFVDECDELLMEIQSLPDSCRSASEWQEKVRDIRNWAQEKTHYTDAQKTAVERIASGVSRWQ